jgi:hypothetical protein
MSAFLADLLVVAHLLFIAFVMAGGALLIRWPRLIWLHFPAAIWGAYIELAGGICPLTPLENNLRFQAAQDGYSGSFIEHYLLPILYPTNLTLPIQQVLGSLVIFVNLGIYAWVFWARHKQEDA